jgi:hypothetical protein
MKLSKSSVERVASAFAGVDLGDPRRVQRVLQTVKNLAAHPRASFPEAMGSESNLEGAYRLMSSSRVTMAQLNDSHARVTAERARAARQVLAIHDTTTFEFKRASPEDIGYLNTGKAGFAAHYTLLVTRDDERRPLGITYVEPICRRKPPSKRSPTGRRDRKRCGGETVRNPERESTRWLRGIESTEALLDGVDLIHVADRESDNYELLAKAIEQGARFVIRARVLTRRVVGDGEMETLRTVVDGATGILSREVELAARKRASAPRSSYRERASRVASLTFSATRAEIQRPKYHVDLPGSLQVNVVRVFEANPPPNEEPIEWVLLTSEPISTQNDVAAIVDIYRARWLIEECNKALKTGCRYEDRQFESLDALLTLLALTLPVACELLWLRSSCRRNPTAPASSILTATQLKVLAIMGPRKPGPKPTVRDALWAIAALGGHMKSNGEPGWLVLHRGMTKLLAYEQGWLARENLAGLKISR